MHISIDMLMETKLGNSCVSVHAAFIIFER